MDTNTDIKSLPQSMAERAIWARNEFIKNPKNSQIDDGVLIWCYNKKDKLWYSILGNYSSSSPEEKRMKELQREERMQAYQKSGEQIAEEHYELVLYQSGIRQKVLERDKYTCQLCGAVSDTKLHIHHILKRDTGGTDHLDNLITVCVHCHKPADTKLYNPPWKK